MCTRRIDTTDRLVGWVLTLSVVLILLVAGVGSAGCSAAPAAEPFVPVDATLDLGVDVYAVEDGATYDAEGCVSGTALVYGVPGRVELCFVELDGHVCPVVTVEALAFIGHGAIPKVGHDACEAAFGPFRAAPRPLTPSE